MIIIIRRRKNGDILFKGKVDMIKIRYFEKTQIGGTYELHDIDYNESVTVITIWNNNHEYKFSGNSNYIEIYEEEINLKKVE